MRRWSWLFLAVLLLPQPGAWAQAYPSRPIRFVAPQPPGGTFDYAVRVIAERLQPSLGQAVVVENKSGAGNLMGFEFVAKQPADGYTIMMGSTTLPIMPSLIAKLPFDPVRDFSPVGMVLLTPFVLAVDARLPIRSVNEYIAAARARPGALTYGSSGVGTPLHFAGELLKSMANIDMLHVPFKGAAPIVQAMVAGEVASTFSPLTPLLAQVRSGKLRVLAAVASRRSLILPDLPTIAEAVPLPGYAMDTWFGIFGPARMPQPIVARLNGELNRIVEDPVFVKEKLLSAGLEPMGSTPERLQQVLEADIARYAKIARDANIRAE